MIKKKILYISQVFPYPADGGGKIKTLSTLEALSKKYTISAIFVSEEKPTRSQIDYLKKIGVNSVTVFYNKSIHDSVKDNYVKLFFNFLLFNPHYVFQYTSPGLYSRIQELIKRSNPDVIHIDHINIAQYLPKKKSRAKWILEHHNVEYRLLLSRFIHSEKLSRKLFLFFETFFTYLYERRKIRQFDFVFTISDEEASLVKSIFNITNVASQPLVYSPSKLKRKETKNKSLLFVGNLCWPPNEDAIEWFVTHIVPAITQKIPDISINIVGKTNKELSKRLPTLKNILFHGYVKDFSSLMKNATVFVLPIRMGAGVRIKALTALSAGIPIVSTSLGVDGLKVRDNVHFLRADTVQLFATKVINLLKSPSKRNQMSQAQREYIKQYHSKNANTKWVEFYDSVCFKQ